MKRLALGILLALGITGCLEDCTGPVGVTDRRLR